ncbi:hypothetical protein R1flu_003498 [Riccia fluitans]|uniref:Protein phosphatase 1 regulatory subunit 7 n=1 Tax=Riccia fluitans TaxID=41844 RepID=A0ABD1Y961_9MARC
MNCGSVRTVGEELGLHPALLKSFRITDVREQEGKRSISELAEEIGSRWDLDQLMGLDVCERLTRLDLSDNRLSSLEGITLCTKLTWLSVAGNQLSSLTGVENLAKLTVLNASKNEITSMAEVVGLTELRALILNDNEITSVPKLDRLANLNTIVLSRNPIRNLGNFASKLLSLKKLSMSHCQVQLIGTALKRCVTVEELRLAHNQLTTLPQELERNGRLTILDLGTNHIKSWSDVQILETLHYLVNLNLRGNPLCSQEGYQDMVRKKLPYLQVLDGHNLQVAPRRKASKKALKSNKENGAIEQEPVSDNPSENLPGEPKRKKLNGSAPENDTLDDSKRKSFFELISVSSTTAEEDSSAKASENITKGSKDGKPKKKKKEDSGVVSVVDNTKGRYCVNKVKKVDEILAKVITSTDIGTGGPSTWDDEPTSLTTEVTPKVNTLPGQMNVNIEHKPYNRWALKRKK